MLKKSLIIGSMLLVFSGCAIVKNETPEQVLSQNQIQIIEKVEKYLSPFSILEVKTDAIIDIKSNEGNITLVSDSQFDFDKEKRSFFGELGTNVNIVSSEVSGSGQMSLSTVLSNKILYAKLNNFNLSIPGQESIDFIKMMIKGYVGQWISFDLGKQDLNLSAFFLDINTISNTYKKYSILKSVRINEDKDFYDFNVSLNEGNIIKIVEALNSLDFFVNKMTEEKITKFKDNLSKINFNGNIKVNPKKKQFFIFSGSIDDAKINIVNNKEKIKIIFSSDGSEMILDFKKSTKGSNGTIVINESGKEILKSNLNFEFSNNHFNILGDFTSDRAKVNLDIKNTFNTKKSIEISVPKKFKTVKEMILGAGLNIIDESGSGQVDKTSTDLFSDKELNNILTNEK